MNKTIENLKKLKSFHNGSYGADIDKAIKALEIVEEFERAQIITGGRLNGRTNAYKCGLEDGKRKALEQQSQEPILDKIYVDIQSLRNLSCIGTDAVIDEVEDIIDKYRQVQGK